jgi:Ca-activated chloride channel family protein
MPHSRGRLQVLVVAVALAASGCRPKERAGENRPGTAAPPAPPANAVTVTFTYGSEKQKWIEEATERFHRSNPKTKDGRPIRIEAVPMGSGECVDEVLEGRRQTHLMSPASAAFMKLGNAASRQKTNADLVGPTENLVLSPVVIAMWKPMADALSKGGARLGWADVLAVAKNPQGWGAYGHPEWGAFKFGHTHPRFSNSGLIALTAEIYAATGKKAGLTPADVAKKATGDYVAAIQRAVVHYGSSTGFFGRKMFEAGPGYLSAAVLYENMVIEASGQPNLAMPVVAIYPKEGTFWSDHPIGIVNRPWVTDAHKEAAQAYVRYLLAREQQERAIGFGFRPGDPQIPLGAPIDAAHGVDPKEPQTTLEVPSAEVLDAALLLFDARKKSSHLVLALDTSGSMRDEGKLVNAKAAAALFVDMLGEKDDLDLLLFSNKLRWGAGGRIGDARETLKGQLAGLFAEGGTALYDAVGAAVARLKEKPDDERISAAVLLTDGDDRDSRTKLDDLLASLGSDAERGAIRVFTIGYGRDARKDVLKRIADRTQAKFYEGTPANIREVFKDISTFF